MLINRLIWDVWFSETTHTYIFGTLFRSFGPFFIFGGWLRTVVSYKNSFGAKNWAKLRRCAGPCLQCNANPLPMDPIHSIGLDGILAYSFGATSSSADLYGMVKESPEKC